jgi:hypothetical protein
MSLFERSIPGRRVILPEEHHDSWLCGEAGKEVLISLLAYFEDRDLGNKED